MILDRHPEALALAASVDLRGLVGDEGALGGSVVFVAPGDDGVGAPVGFEIGHGGCPPAGRIVRGMVGAGKGGGDDHCRHSGVARRRRGGLGFP